MCHFFTAFFLHVAMTYSNNLSAILRNNIDDAGRDERRQISILENNLFQFFKSVIK